MCAMTRSYVPWLAHMCRDSLVCAITHFYMWQGHTGHVMICDVIHSVRVTGTHRSRYHMWRDLLWRDVWQGHHGIICDVTHCDVTHSLICDVTHSVTCDRDTQITLSYVTWLTVTWLTRSYVTWRTHTCNDSLICTMTRSYVPWCTHVCDRATPMKSLDSTFHRMGFF